MKAVKKRGRPRKLSQLPQGSSAKKHSEGPIASLDESQSPLPLPSSPPHIADTSSSSSPSSAQRRPHRQSRRKPISTPTSFLASLHCRHLFLFFPVFRYTTLFPNCLRAPLLKSTAKAPSPVSTKANLHSHFLPRLPTLQTPLPLLPRLQVHYTLSQLPQGSSAKKHSEGPIASLDESQSPLPLPSSPPYIADTSSSSSPSSAEEETWRWLVEREWERVSVGYDRERESALPSLLAGLRAEAERHLPRRHRLSDGRVPKPLNWRTAREAPTGAAWSSAKSVEKGGAGSRCQIRIMPPVRPVPRVNAWLPVPHNVWEPDSAALTHIPAGTETDEEFVKELISHYDYQVHGRSSGDFINDHLLFQLMHNLQKNHAANIGAGSHVGIELPRVAYEAVAKAFPDKGSAKVLRETKYPDLLARYAAEESRAVMAENMAGNVDSEMGEPLLAEKALHTFSSLFCPRCLIYDCFLHGNEPPTPLPKRKVTEKEREGYLRENVPSPCSVTCHLLPPASTPSSSQSSPLSPGRRKTTASLALVPPNQHPWTNADITMFRVMRGIYGQDYCAIKRAMLAPHLSCRDVFNLAASEGPVSPLGPGSSPVAKSGRRRNQADAHHRFRLMKWARDDAAGQVTNQHPYRPCVHPPGEKCGPENCWCKQSGVPCMKFCQCGSEKEMCSYRFPGCRCKAHCTTKQCPCFMAYRECDPDLCKPCGASDMSGEDIGCKNVNIQRGWGRPLLQGPSEVAGWGMFLGEAVAKGGFISEYCGEVISQEEADRRGKIYDRSGCSYLFNLNSDQAVDATRKGNQIRFANHSSYPNCATKVLMVNGDHRIGIFAKQDLRAGDELFFDYRYKPGEQLQFVSIERPRARPIPE